MKKVLLYIIVSLLAIGTTILGVFGLRHKLLVDAYNNAITLIENGSYEEALTEFENTNVLKREDFKHGKTYLYRDECYKNTVPLYAYALARIEYNTEDRYPVYINNCLQFIPSDYNGELSEEINTFKEEFKPLYDEYIAEKEREAKKREEEYLAWLKTKIPFKGLEKERINSTATGPADKHKSEFIEGWGSNPGRSVDKYYWYSDDMKDKVLYVRCEDGIVVDVYKYYESTYWTFDGMPKFWATRQRRTTYNNTSTKKEDPYNVNDYYNAEDFYDDNYDDFWDYEDAEDYYNEYHD